MSTIDSPHRLASRRRLLERSLSAIHDGARSDRIVRRSASEPPPLSCAQERLWLAEQLQAGRPTYNELAAVCLIGPLNVAAFRRSIAQVVERHDVLRTAFVTVAGVPRPVVGPSEDRLDLVDLRRIAPATRPTAVRRVLRQLFDVPFDLREGSLLRPVLVRTHDREHAFVVVAHHIAFDLWSARVFLRELSACYAALVEGRPSYLSELPIQYADYSQWERERLEAGAFADALETLAQRFAHVPLVNLPARRAGHPAGGGRTRWRDYVLPAGTSSALRALAAGERASLSNVLLAAFQALLYRYTGQTDFSIGVPVANRARSECRDLIGLFVNTVLLRADLSGDPTVSQLIARTVERSEQAYAFQHVPYERVVQHLQPDRREGAGLFNVVWAFQNVPDAMWACRDVRIAPGPTLDSAFTLFDLEMRAWDAPDGIHLHLIGNADAFAPRAIDRLAQHFATILADIADGGADRHVSDLALLAEEERRQLAEWNRSARAWPYPALIQDGIAAAAARAPDAVTVVYGDAHLCRAALNQRANQLAHHLRALGVAHGVRVGLFLERGPELIIAILGILRADAAYVPLDPGSPAARTAMMIEDAQVSVVVTTAALAHRLPSNWAQEVHLDREWPQIARLTVSSPPSSATSDSLACIMYTSGSTGRPKGVSVTHRGVRNLAAAQSEAFGITDGSGVLQFASLNFDATTSEWTTALLSGGRLVLAPVEALRPGRELLELMARHRIEVVTLPPSVLAVLPDASLPALRTLVVAGEAVSEAIAGRWSAGRVFLNAYGPTEGTVCATLSRPLTPGAAITIGGPIANAEAHVLGRDGALVPIGAAGELYVGGSGVAQGYVNAPAQTAERFVPDPFGGPGARLYRTGDRVRRRADGQLEFLGRLDHQVKWRGYRIEPQEIEVVLAEHPGVRHSVVILRDATPGDPRLLAYVLPVGMPPTEEQLRQHIAARLPDYMMPSAFVTVDRWPLTATGKIDRAALPLPQPGAGPVDGDDAPRTPFEEIVADVWRQVLGRTDIGRNADFFALGGHSLLATQAIGRLAAAVGIDVPLRVLFDTPSVAAVAAALEAARQGAATPALPAIRPTARDHGLPLSFAQQRLWFLDQLEPNSAVYNCHAAVRLSGPLNVRAFRASLTAIVRRHEVLRTCFSAAAGESVQNITPPAPVPLPTIDLACMSAAARDRVARRLAHAEATTGFDLARGPLLRVRLLRLGDREHVLLLTLHHVASDAWSLSLFVRELGAGYDAACRGATPNLPDLPVQYADFAAWQREWLQGAVLEAQVGYWRARLADAPVLAIPTDLTRPAIATGRGGRRPWVPATSVVVRLAEVCRQHGVTAFMTLLAAYQVLLGRYAGQIDVVVGTDVANRTRAETERLIGFFVNQLVLRTDVGGNPTFRTLLARVRETTLQAYAHQDLPFEKLVEVLSPTRDPSRSPLFQVALVVQNTPSATLVLRGLDVTILERRQTAAKHDLTLVVQPTSDGLQGDLEYAADLFDATTVERLLRHFDSLLAGLLDQPDRRIDEVSLLPAAERAEVLSFANHSRPACGAATPVATLIAGHARRRPHAIAVAHDEDHVSYAEVNRRANQLGRFLTARGIHTESRVGIAGGRTSRGVIALLGVLKAGAAAVPFDSGTPPARLAQMIRDADVRLVVGAEPADELDVSVVLGTEEWRRIDAESPTALRTEVRGGALAYVMYTSGSTGVPKGVGITHDALNAYIHAITRTLGLTAADRILQLASWSFDVALEEMLPALACGATVVLAPEAWMTRATVSALAARHQITAVEVPTAYWDQWASDIDQTGVPACLRFVIVGGERILPASVRAWQQTGVPLLHVYGLTETAITSTIHRLDPHAAPIDTRREFPIGPPLAHASAYVLDDDGELAPIGVPGELYIGGPGLARGYLRQPALTAERFVPDRWSGRRGDRVYRTGDRARWRADGTVEFAGRLDAQVKVRGYRVEPGEVEQALREHPALREVVVLAQKEPSGQTSLIAYVTPAPGYRAGRDGRSIDRRRIELWPSHGEYPIYDDLLYRAMVDDDLRNREYRAALLRVAAGKVVVDVGTGGEALLARLAVDAGAAKVYAIEALDDAFHKAAARVQELGLSERIVLLRGDAMTMTLPEPVDVCVSELIGSIGSAEGAVSILQRARQWLRPDAAMVPRRCVTRIAAVTLPREVTEAPAFEELGARYAQQIFDSVGHRFDVRVCLRHVPPDHILSSCGTFEDLDFSAAAITADAPRYVILAITRAGRLDGLLLWIELQIGDAGVVSALDDGCAWLPVFFPAFEPALDVRPGDFVHCFCTSRPSSDGVHPDYFVAGVVRQVDGPGRAFSYASYHHREADRPSHFHRRLIESAAIPFRDADADRITAATLRAHAAGRLPAYMTPAALTALEAMPLTTNGKVDRRALAARRRPDEVIAPSAPRTPIEVALAEIWCELLGRSQVGIHEDFFDAGGHSLLAAQLVSRIQRRFDVEMPLRSVFDRPTIDALAAQIVGVEAATRDDEALRDLLSEVEEMSDAAARALLAGEAERVS